MSDKTSSPAGTETSSVVGTQRPASTQFHDIPPEGDSGKSRAWVWLIILAIIGAAGYFMYRQYQSMQTEAAARNNNRPKAVPVTTAKVQKSNMNVYVGPVIGTVTPIYTQNITSRVQGQIVNIYYREGQTVHKDDPLIDIDPRPYQAAVTQMEGMLARDQAVLAEARIDLDRYQTAYSRNAIAKQQLDDQTQAVAQDEGTVKNDQGQLDNARVNLTFCHITSSIDGRVGLRLVDLGNIVQANSTTPLAVVTQLHPITVIFSVDQGFLTQIQQQLREGHTLDVDALDREQQTKIASGKLLTLDNQVDVTTDTVKLRASFSNADNLLFPNEFVNARLLLTTQNNDTVVPSAAIQRNAQGAFVYLIGSDQKATVHNVTPGVTDNNLTAVTGINPGDVVATAGFNALQDGIEVTLPGQGRGSGSGRGGRGNARGSGNGTASGEDAP